MSEVKKQGVTTHKQYIAIRKDNPSINWPSNPNLTYPDWVSWVDLFGKEKKKFISLVELKEAIKKRGINSIRQYKKILKAEPNLPWPTSPYRTYTDWKSQQDLFGREKRVFFEFLDELKDSVRKNKINSQREYRELRNKDLNLPWPSDPNRIYPDWKSWPDLFGKEQYISLSLQY